MLGTGNERKRLKQLTVYSVQFLRKKLRGRNSTRLRTTLSTHAVVEGASRSCQCISYRTQGVRAHPTTQRSLRLETPHTRLLFSLHLSRLKLSRANATWNTIHPSHEAQKQFHWYKMVRIIIEDQTGQENEEYGNFV